MIEWMELVQRITETWKQKSRDFTSSIKDGLSNNNYYFILSTHFV